MLIELIIVIVIFGILVVIVVFWFIDFQFDVWVLILEGLCGVLFGGIQFVYVKLVIGGGQSLVFIIVLINNKIVMMQYGYFDVDIMIFSIGIVVIDNIIVGWIDIFDVDWDIVVIIVGLGIIVGVVIIYLEGIINVVCVVIYIEVVVVGGSLSVVVILSGC